jgi:hypothetical protein
MVDTSQAVHSHFSYARGGVLRGVSESFGETLPARAELTVDVQLADGAGSAAPNVFVYGPGDVTALDEGQVARFEPKRGANDWTPSWFPMIEFERPDLPWLFSPYAPETDRLRPWCVLVVVELRDGVTYEESRPPTQRPALTVEGPASGSDPRTVPDIELPDLDESWAWAHVHMSGDYAGADLDEESQTRPELVVSRLVSPRRLHPGRSYRACLVPAFEAGRAAGLGEKQIDDTLAPAWTAGEESVTLPVYYSWEFGTGLEGDFASLARLLKPILSPDGVGAQAMDATQPGGGLPSAGATMGGLQGALQAPGADLGNGPTATFAADLRALLNAGQPSPGQPPRALELPPPIYGRWPAAATSVPGTKGKLRPWVAELNLDPRHRAAAALGTLVVQRRQEQLMASAWAQVGPIDLANQVLRQAQLARQAAGSTYATRFLALSPAPTVLLLGAPALARVPAGGAAPATLSAQIQKTRLAPTLSPAFRRIGRRRSPLASRAGSRGRWPESLVARLNKDPRVVVPLRRKPDGTETAAVAGADQTTIAQGDLSSLHLDGPMQRQTFQQAAVALQGELDSWTARADPAPRPLLDLAGTRAKLVRALDPDQTLPARVATRVKVPQERAWDPEDPLEGIMAAPEFPTPMVTALAELSQDYLMPGLANLPQNSVTVLEANNRFINSFMIGLNHEMSRELLWREYPTDQRGTYFRQFWDPSTRVPPPGETSPPDLHDLSPIHTWPPLRRLDKGEGAAQTGKLVLVVRGQLLRRFAADVLAIEATKGTPRGLGAAEKWPIFEGRLDPDLNFFGFELSRTEAKTGGSEGAGWFFVLQQHPTKPHYGLEEEEPGTANVPGGHPASWADLSWAHLCATQADLDRLSYAPAAPPKSATPTSTSGPAWGTDSAQAAAVALRVPVRIAIHATDLLP